MLVRITVGSRAGEIVDMPPMVAARAMSNGTAELVEEEPQASLPQTTETAQDVQPEVAAFDTGKKRVFLKKRH